ncbi:cobW-domain-containing protein [Microthyrium microscopicum]|uniref:CobW-domain-containing protein n=1 Tax=Microthyrium microscopicum TaxID=703497 RepID=A0A6A6U1R8_9PEZI|nr:cobW-domain-containing protein [Microthyrium microscopicum]
MIPITIITGFLGSGKTTLILNLIPQVPETYRLALIKNEFGDVAVDSQLAGAQAISGVKELLNGCICCNLVGSLAEALETLRTEQNPDRFIIETSGSAFPATLAMEVNRISRETGHYQLDGVISLIDVENWKGYEDTSYTAKVQARYTDLLVLSKWELVSEREYDDCIDRILDLDLDIPTPRVKSNKGWVDKDLLLGLDAKLAKTTKHGDYQHIYQEHEHEHDTDHGHDHQSEVEVLSITLNSDEAVNGVDLEKLEMLLESAPKDEVYRIKALIYAFEGPASSTGEHADAPAEGTAGRYILNWAFGRWTFTAVPRTAEDAGAASTGKEPVLRMTIVTARYEGQKWAKRAESSEYIAVTKGKESAELRVRMLS